MLRPPHAILTTIALFTIFAAVGGPEARAVGVLYGDPGWFYAYGGQEAFYNDLDGPNPDYINGDDTNRPGGQGNTPALIDPRVADPTCDPSVPTASPGGCASAEWIHQSTNWDGSAPGDPLGGIPTGTPPIPPAAPGGVAALNESGVDFLRVQDPGNPVSYGWPDKGLQAGPGQPRQEGSNRKIQFGHDMTVDPAFSGDPAILDNGVTISFRIRLATAASGPLDDIFPEGGSSLSSTVAWPENGLGYPVANEGRGMIHLAQTGAGGPQQMAFSLVDQDTLTFQALPITKTGLVMNNRANAGVADDVDTNMATDETLNVVEIPDDQLDQWQEFWINIEELAAPIDGNTHGVTVYHNGEVDNPQTFEIVLGPENEFNDGAFLGLGLSSGTAQGAYDLDFYAYREGIIAPTLATPDADLDDDGDVDGADFLLVQRTEPQRIGDWEAAFGTGVPVNATGTSTPEPGTALLSLAGVVLLGVGRRQRSTEPSAGGRLSEHAA